MQLNLAKDAKWLVVHAPVAAGATDITDCTVVDTAGYDNVVFAVKFGAIVTGAVTSIKVQQSSDNSADTYADLAGSNVAIADDQDGKIALVEIIRPRERYLKLQILRATQNATVDAALAILHGGGVMPATQSDVAGTAEVHGSPAEGTA